MTRTVKPHAEEGSARESCSGRAGGDQKSSSVRGKGRTGGDSSKTG